MYCDIVMAMYTGSVISLSSVSVRSNVVFFFFLVVVLLVMVCSLPEPSGPRFCDHLGACYFVSASGISFIVLFFFFLQVLFTLSFFTAHGHDCQMLAFGAFVSVLFCLDFHWRCAGMPSTLVLSCIV